MKIVSTLFVSAVFVSSISNVYARSEGSWRLSDDIHFFGPPRRHRKEPHRCGNNNDRPPYPPRGDHPGPDILSPPPQHLSGHGAELSFPSTESSTSSSITLPKFEGARWVAFFNVLLFAFRPDPDLGWPARVPRVLWEFVLWFNLRQTRSDNVPSIFYVWLSFLTGTTGVIDLFFWAPIFAALVSFEHCDGGWLQPKICRPDPVKGYGRLLVAIQAVVGGMTYLHAAFHSANVLLLRRAEDRRKHQELLQRLHQQQHHQVASRPTFSNPYYRR